MISTTLEAIRSMLAASLTAGGVSVPARTYIHAGEVAYDCEQLVVTLTGIVAPRAQTSNPCPSLRYAQASAHLVICVPSLTDDLEAPTAADLDAAGIEVADAAEVFAAGLADALLALGCQNVSLDGVVLAGPDGGYVAVVGSFSFDLSG